MTAGLGRPRGRGQAKRGGLSAPVLAAKRAELLGGTIGSGEGRFRRHLVWAAVAVAYLVVFPYFHALNNPNENVRIWETRAIASHGTFSIVPVEAEWGPVGDRAVYGGRLLSSKAPGTSLLGVPVHAIHDRLTRLIRGHAPSVMSSTWVLRVFTVALPLALFLFLFSRRVESETRSPFARDLLTLGLGLGTMFFPYGLAFVGHAQAAALLFVGYLALVPGRAARVRVDDLERGERTGLSARARLAAVTAPRNPAPDDETSEVFSDVHISEEIPLGLDAGESANPGAGEQAHVDASAPAAERSVGAQPESFPEVSADLSLSEGLSDASGGVSLSAGASSTAVLLPSFVVPPRRLPAARLMLGGLLCGLAVCFEYQAVVAAALVTLYALVVERQRTLWFLLGALGPALALGAYHALLFGSPWSLPYAHLDDPTFTLYHHTQGFLGLGRPHAAVLQAAFVTADYGLFVFSPFLAVGLVVSLVAVVRSGHRQQALIAAVTGAMAVFVAGMANWRGGWCAGGPRYIATVVPFLVWALALSWRRFFAPRWWAAAGLTGLVLASVGLCVLCGLFPHFPLQFDNPIFDLVVPLVRAGYAPHSMGTLVGLHGLASLAPLAVVVSVAVVVTLATPPRRRALTVLSALVVAALFVGGLSRHPGGLRPEEQTARDFVRALWEPIPTSRPVDVDQGTHGAP